MARNPGASGPSGASRAEPRGVAARGGEFADSFRDRRTKARQPRHTLEFRTVDPLHDVFDNEVKHRVGHLRKIRGKLVHESGKGLDQAAPEEEPFARDAVLQMLLESRGRHEKADSLIAPPQRLTDPLENDM